MLFRSHKNHARILEALCLLKNKGNKKHVVFVGGDKGNRKNITEMVEALNLSEQVHILGFVDSKSLKYLYQNCSAVLMPTYFGPTNIPPLEAWLFGKPIIYSRHLCEQTSDAAWYVDPDSAKSIADALEAVDNPLTVELLLVKSKVAMERINQKRSESEVQFAELLKRTALRMRCFNHQT